MLGATARSAIAPFNVPNNNMLRREGHAKAFTCGRTVIYRLSVSQPCDSAGRNIINCAPDRNASDVGMLRKFSFDSIHTVYHVQTAGRVCIALIADGLTDFLGYIGYEPVCFSA